MIEPSAVTGLNAHFACQDPEPLLAAPPDLIEFLPVAVYACDSAGRIRWFNAKAAALWGRSPEPGETAGQLCRPHPDESSQGRAVTIERPDGSRVTATIHVTALKDRRGNIVGAIACLHEPGEPVREDRSAGEPGQRRLFAELNHRTKNNLQMLYALLAAARRETGDDGARLALDEAAQRVAAMAAAQTALYQSDNVDRFDSAPFMRSVCAAAEAGCTDKVRLDLSAESGTLANDWAVPLALILNELISNAAKHGVDAEAGGTIRIGLTREGPGFALVVEDDGPGFDLCGIRRNSSGLGLVLGLARQIGGTFEVERRSGARCVLQLPASPEPSAWAG